MPDSIGLYIHIPFCAKKCRYCDFYSGFLCEKVYRDYLSALRREIKKWSKKIDRSVDTVYLGGGTPSLLGKDIISVMQEIRSGFSVSSNAEITVECNPNADIAFLNAAKKSGVNRLSLGVQSGNDKMLKTLGRSHTVSDVKQFMPVARELGFDNISCDIMIALPDSSINTLKSDIDFVCSLSPEHISAYILKVEPDTAFYKMQDKLNLPGEDGTAEQYLVLCREIENKGYEHYEISNFARENKKSRHNLKYWRCEEYLGIGPSAHSYLAGKRFYYPRDIKAFNMGNEPVLDGQGGSREEKIMLSLRTNDGVPVSDIPSSAIQKVKKFETAELLNISDGQIRLSDRGMLLSNSIITEILYEDL